MAETATIPASPEALRSLIERSGLLSSELAEPVFAGSNRSKNAAADLDAIVDSLVKERLLTPFQARLLMKGRATGYFLGEKYKLLEFIGSGGMGKVYLAEHLMLRRLVSIKLLQFGGQVDEQEFTSAVERFHREARAVAALDHPNIVRVFDVDRVGRHPFMVMEYVDGTNLHALVTRHGALSIERAVDCVAQAAAGLEHAYREGLVHRDIKPSNVLLDRAGAVKVLDLGLARFSRDIAKNEGLTTRFDQNTVIGTVDFISPEQVANSSKVDCRSDIYSLGCTMYFVLTGRVPYPDMSLAQKMFAHQNQDMEPIGKLRPKLPSALVAIIERMTEKCPEDRYQTPAEIVAALARWTAKPLSSPPREQMPQHPASHYRLGLTRPPAGPAAPAQTPKPGSSSETPRESSPGDWRDAEMPPSDEILSLDGAELAPTKNDPALRTRQAPRRNRLGGALAVAALLLAIAGGVSWWRAGRHAGERTEPPGKQTGPEAPPLVEGKEPKGPFLGVILSAGGSTFVNPVMQHWASIYEKLKGVRIDYREVGSGKGRQGAIDRVFVFGCSDAPVDDEQINQVKQRGGRLLHVPLVMGAVVPAYNLPAVAEQLRFTGKALGDIYLGRITHWDDEAIQASNPGVALPHTKITVIRRLDASGTTYIWTDYLAKVSGEFKMAVGVGTEVVWPVGESGRGNQGVADLIGRNIGSIGYIELNYALENNLHFGLLKNKEGKLVKPSLESVTAAAAASLAIIPDDLRYSLTDAPGADSYPVVGTAWAILYADQSSNPAAADLVEFLRWATHEGQVYVKDLKYAPLPPELIKRIADQLAAIKLPQKK